MDEQQTAFLLAVPMHARPAVYSALTGDQPDNCPVRCDAPGCGAVVPLSQSHSFYVGHRYTAGLAPVECQHESSDSGQHFGCSIEHAAAATRQCFEEHVLPAHAAILERLNTPPQEEQQQQPQQTAQGEQG